MRYKASLECSEEEPICEFSYTKQENDLWLHSTVFESREGWSVRFRGYMKDKSSHGALKPASAVDLLGLVQTMWRPWLCLKVTPL